MRRNHLLAISSAGVVIVILTVSALPSALAAASQPQNRTSIIELLKSIDHCVVQSVYSFIYANAYLPTNATRLQSTCRAQAEAFKCVRDKGKLAPALIKRGLSALVSTRQRHSRKYCANVNSDLSKRFLEANKCIMEKKLEEFKASDVEFANYMLAIRDQNFADSTTELHHFCCASINWRKNFVSRASPECAQFKEMIEETVSSIVSSEIHLICDDEDKLMTKICPKLEPMKLPKTFVPKAGNSPSTIGLYLIATLGEPDARR